MTRPAYLVAAAATAAAMATAACGATTSVTVTNGSPRPMASRPIHEVTVFTAGVPGEPFVEVAVIQARDTATPGMAALVGDMRVQAAGLGCDALLVYGGNNPIATDARPPVGRANDGLWGACIVYLTQQPAPPAPIPSPLPVLAPPPAVAVPAPVAPAAAPPIAVAPAPVVAPAAPVVAPAAPAPAAVAPAPSASDSVLVRMFDRLDRDRNRVLTPDEIPAGAHDRLVRYDTSGDGWITRDEIEAADAASQPERTHAWGRRRR